MTGVGRGTVQAIQDGRWIVLDCEQDQFLPDGTLVLKWQLHWVTGWSPEHGEYRAVMTDNYGHAELYRGRIDGDRLVFDSMEGAAPRLRFTWDVSDPALITWRNEMAVGDGSWCLIKAGADPKTRAVAPIPATPEEMASTWQWVLNAVDNGRRTRLVVRQRLSYPRRQAVLWRLVEPVSFVMERRMLHGIKARAEDHHTAPSAEASVGSPA